MMRRFVSRPPNDPVRTIAMPLNGKGITGADVHAKAAKTLEQPTIGQDQNGKDESHEYC